jgi:hypothetical protein
MRQKRLSRRRRSGRACRDSLTTKRCSRSFTSLNDAILRINDAMLWIDDAILRINDTILRRMALRSILGFVGQLYYMKMASSSRGRLLFRGGDVCGRESGDLCYGEVSWPKVRNSLKVRKGDLGYYRHTDDRRQNRRAYTRTATDFGLSSLLRLLSPSCRVILLHIALLVFLFLDSS